MFAFSIQKKNNFKCYFRAPTIADKEYILMDIRNKERQYVRNTVLLYVIANVVFI